MRVSSSLSPLYLFSLLFYYRSSSSSSSSSSSPSFSSSSNFCASSMAVLPTSSSSLELTISVPGFNSSPNLFPSSSVKELDMNQIPLEEDWMVSNMEDEEESSNGDPPRKKLRLTKEQSRLLEESFRQNHTLNPKQKEALAMQLKLRPRQVEVWFQNRRARSKLKQTEMECEYLKRWFGSLTEQNRRLQREVEELRAMKVGPPTVISPHTSEPLPASTLTMCPRCERVTSTAVTAITPDTAAATLSAKASAPTLQSRQPHSCTPPHSHTPCKNNTQVKKEKT